LGGKSGPVPLIWAHRRAHGTSRDFAPNVPKVSQVTEIQQINPPKQAPKLGSARYYSLTDVEEAMVEAARLWRRSPGGGRWPFASDGPWHLMTRATRAGSAIDAWRVEIDEIALKPDPAPLPLTRAEIARRDEASAWLLLIAGEDDRRLVAMGLMMKARTGKRIDWVRMVAMVGGLTGVPATTDGLRKRYNRALGAVARVLSSGEGPR
jgi:hypothetical protein